jgi:glycosyltransferase involved in cell wall biosynthesis
VLEAMDCSILVLAAPVGGITHISGITHIIRDKESGFIMEDNSPENIAKNVIRIPGHPNLEQISRNACALVEREYTYQAALERYGKILESLEAKN